MNINTGQYGIADMTDIKGNTDKYRYLDEKGSK